jgi:hypothetical protein
MLHCVNGNEGKVERESIRPQQFDALERYSKKHRLVARNKVLCVCKETARIRSGRHVVID